MKIGHACTIMSLITDLKLAMGVCEPRKWNSDLFSNYTYLLTILSSLKLLPLVSETEISLSNYTYLLTVLLTLLSML